MIDERRMGPPCGIKHGKATATWEEVEHCRTLRERNGMTVRQISAKTGWPVDTVRDWIYYRTRHYA